MVHLGLKNQINTWIVTYSLDLTLAQPSPSCSKNLCYLRKKKYMQSPRNICQDQQHRNKNERDQPEEVYLLKLFLFSGQWNPEHEATLRADSQVMACIFFFPFLLGLLSLSFLYLYFSICKTLTDLTWLKSMSLWLLFTLARVGSLGILDLWSDGVYVHWLQHLGRQHI